MRSTKEQIFDTSQKLKSANSYAALRVKCTFFNAFAPLKFEIVSLYLVSAKTATNLRQWKTLSKLRKLIHFNLKKFKLLLSVFSKCQK